MDVWVWKQLADRCSALTGYPSHSIYEDFTWDRDDLMSGASDDWAYEHLGVYGWTTEFWDIVHAATGTKQSTHFWYTGPTDAESLAVLRWCDENHPGGYVDWYPYDHPQLGAIELGGWDALSTWINPPGDQLRDEVAGHAAFAVHQALCSPRLEVPLCRGVRLSDDTWRIEVGVANTGWLPTDVSAHARKNKLVKPIVAEISNVDIDGGVAVLDGPARRQLAQLEGRTAMRFTHGNDGTPERAFVAWVVRAQPGTTVEITVAHERSGRVSTNCLLD